MNNILFDDKSKPTFIYRSIVAAPHTPPYKIHKYFARRPYNVFEQLVQNFTVKGEIILDPFCGGGVTIYEGIVKQRKVIGCDLNPLSIFIVRNMVKKMPIDRELQNIIKDLKVYLSYLQNEYLVFQYEDKIYSIDWAEMALSVRCPKCGNPTPLSNNLRIKAGKYHCQNIDCELNKDNGFDVSICERSPAQYLDLINEKNRKKTHKEFDLEDKEIYEKHIKFLKEELSKSDITVPQDIIPLEWDRQFEDGLAKKGILYFQDLFTKRNLYILMLLQNKINSFKGSIGQEKFELLRVIFSNVVKDTNIMSFTNDGWQSGKPTTWSKHAYWVPNQFCEVPIMPAFEKSVERVFAAVKYNKTQNYTPKQVYSFSELNTDDNNLLLLNKPVNFVDIPDDSVDAIITDPPYGSNVQYLELSHFWYPWNKDLYENFPAFELEAVANRKKGFKGAKDQYVYENNLYQVFSKSYKCLKPDKYMTLTFNNKDISSWLGLLFSIFKSGFSFDNMYFQDGVKNYKQTAHTKAEGSPYGDFIYVFKKATPNYTITEYKSEAQFAIDLDDIFKKYLSVSQDKNILILEIFLKAIPLIDGFAKTYLNAHNSHSLYKHFNKNYLSKLFINNENE